MQRELPEMSYLAEAPLINLSAGSETPVAPSTVKAMSPESVLDREPIITVSVIVGVLMAMVTWAVARGFLGEADEAFAITIVPVAGAILFAKYARQSATSVGRAKLAIDEAYAARPGEDAKPKL